MEWGARKAKNPDQDPHGRIREESQKKLRAEIEIARLQQLLDLRRQQSGLPSQLDLRPEFLDDTEVPALFEGFHRLLHLGDNGGASLWYFEVTAWMEEQGYPDHRWEWVRSVFDAMLGTWTKVQRELYPPPTAK